MKKKNPDLFHEAPLFYNSDSANRRNTPPPYGVLPSEEAESTGQVTGSALPGGGCFSTECYYGSLVKGSQKWLINPAKAPTCWPWLWAAFCYCETSFQSDGIAFAGQTKR
jgi:hypothetical protein